MSSRTKRYREPLFIGVLLVYPLASFLASANQGRKPIFVDRIVLTLTSPVQKGISLAIDGVAAAWKGYVALRGVRRENIALREENQALRGELNRVSEAQAENERLKRMLGYAESTVERQIPARVLAINPVATLLSVRIDRGEQDGVRSDMPVVTPDGVVGRVNRVSKGYADVVLMTDRASKIAVKVQRSRARATASGGLGDRLLHLENVLRTEDVQDGDTVITSGTDGIYPSGIVVGRVTSVRRRSHGVFQDAEVIPAVSVARVEEVLVLAAHPREAWGGVQGEAAP